MKGIAKILTSTGLALALIVAVTTNVNADIISFNDSFAPQLTELVNEPLTVSLFDDLGGTRTLNSVLVSVTGQIDITDGSVTNNAANPQTFQFSETAQLFQGTPSGPASLQPLDVVPVFGGTVIGQETYTNLGAGDSAAFGPFTLGPLSDSFSLTAAGDINPFVGIGAFSYDFNTIIGQAFAGGGGNIAADVTTFAEAALTVTYDFEPQQQQVPEPGTLLLLGTGLVGVAYAVRRKNRGR